MMMPKASGREREENRESEEGRQPLTAEEARPLK